MQLTKRKLGLIVAFGWLLVMLIDTHFRLHIGQQNVDVNAVALQTQAVKTQLLTKKHARFISEQYAKYIKVDTPEVEVKANQLAGMSGSDQALQHGRLDKLYIGDKMYQLTGIFGEPEYFAVLKKTDVHSGELEEIKLIHGQQLEDYKVSRLAKGHIQFSLNERHIQLVMFN